MSAAPKKGKLMLRANRSVLLITRSWPSSSRNCTVHLRWTATCEITPVKSRSLKDREPQTRRASGKRHASTSRSLGSW